MSQQSFNAGAALAFLDEVAAQFGSSEFLSMEPAWDAAWIACMTVDSRHGAVAEAAVANIRIEVGRLSIDRAQAQVIC